MPPRKFMPFDAWCRTVGDARPYEKRNVELYGKPMFPPGYNDHRKANAAKLMDKIDALPKAFRHLVHEYDSAVILQFINCGVTKPAHIRHLIDFVRGYYADGRVSVRGDRRTTGG